MPVLAVRQSVTTRVPTLTIDEMPPGVYVYAVVVTDELELRSEAAEVEVEVREER